MTITSAAEYSFRERIANAVCEALEPLAVVHAGWEGGSAAFGAVDQYSDIDLNFIVDDHCSFDLLHAAARSALETVSPVTATHVEPPGCYYKLAAGGEFPLVDLCFFHAGDSDHPLEVERHGTVRPLFDKADWLRAKPLDSVALVAKQQAHLREMQTWFAPSQSFVRKSMLRGREIEALASYWSYTLRPLTQLLRMRYCLLRWDFAGMRYLDRDLPSAVYDELKGLAFVQSLGELRTKLPTAQAWAARLLLELAQAET